MVITENLAWGNFRRKASAKGRRVLMYTSGSPPQNSMASGDERTQLSNEAMKTATSSGLVSSLRATKRCEQYSQA